jgi:NDP-sugar pyrophosphorylase family protein
MKIRINKLQLMQGVTFDHIMANKPMIDKKIRFYYMENVFVIINYYDNNKLYTFDNYQSFRKKITCIIEDW